MDLKKVKDPSTLVILLILISKFEENNENFQAVLKLCEHLNQFSMHRSIIKQLKIDIPNFMDRSMDGTIELSTGTYREKNENSEPKKFIFDKEKEVKNGSVMSDDNGPL